MVNVSGGEYSTSFLTKPPRTGLPMCGEFAKLRVISTHLNTIGDFVKIGAMCGECGDSKIILLFCEN